MGTGTGTIQGQYRGRDGEGMIVTFANVYNIHPPDITQACVVTSPVGVYNIMSIV